MRDIPCFSVRPLLKSRADVAKHLRRQGKKFKICAYLCLSVVKITLSQKTFSFLTLKLKCYTGFGPLTSKLAILRS
jgi:hypothetical protein